MEEQLKWLFLYLRNGFVSSLGCTPRRLCSLCSWTKLSLTCSSRGICRLLKLSDCQGARLKNRENVSFTGTLGVFFGQPRCAGESEKLLLILWVVFHESCQRVTWKIHILDIAALWLSSMGFCVLPIKMTDIGKGSQARLQSLCRNIAFKKEQLKISDFWTFGLADLSALLFSFPYGLYVWNTIELPPWAVSCSVGAAGWVIDQFGIFLVVNYSS